ncbi:MAG TPA: hypothetical protein VK158_05085 [Acidobacteriota bacterium]|nr:hypothetical protein [Acidobacteriota bacterium]
MELLYANAAVKIETRDLLAKLKRVVREVDTHTHVKPASFAASLVLDDIGGFRPSDKAKLATYNATLNPNQKICIDDVFTGYDATFFPVTPTESELEHQASFFLHQSRDLPFVGADEVLRKNGVIGNSNPSKVTYLKKKDFTDYTGCGDSDIYLDANSDRYCTAHIRFIIDTKKLAATRTIFRDPEGLVDSQEYLNTYLVFGGIPLSAVKTVKIAADMKPANKDFYYDIIRRHHKDLII